MNIVVCVKQTFDSETRIVLNHEGLIEKSQVQYIVNPYDEYALEEAIRIKECGGGRVTAVSVDHNDSSQALHQCLAMGADEAIAVADPFLSQADSHSYAFVLSRLIKTIDYDLIMCGKEAIDDGASQVPTRLASILNLPLVNFVSKVDIAGDKVEATRDIDGGKELVEVNFPCILTAQKGLNDPRYPPLRHILLAKKKGIRRVTLSDLGLSPTDIAPLSHIREYVAVPPREGGKVLAGELQEVISQVVMIIREEAKVL
jgi:electron transfer flavoprotein beta subunit